MRGVLKALLLLAAAHACAAGQSWTALGTGIDGPVYTLAVYQNELYAGGEFVHAGRAWTSNIARWDGSTWSPVGLGANAAVHSLFVYEGRLYAGGKFTSCGGVECTSVARWDGTAWEPVGSGLNGPVFAIAEYHRVVYVGGDFTRAGTGPANRIAAWDGGSWRSVSGGFSSAVYALKVTAADDLFADLYAGGAFTEPDLSNIAWYHPAYQTWLATVWGGFNAPVFAFANYNGGLVAGGSFTSTGAGSRANRLAQRGNEFYGGADGGVYALHSEGGRLYAGGSFRRVGPAPGLEAANIALWNGGGWEALGSGTNDTVRALVVFQGLLYAGGEFDSAGGAAVNHVARWGVATDVMSTSATLPAGARLLQNYPNPFNPSTTIRYELPASSEVRLSVYDLPGREVAVLVDEMRGAGAHEVRFDASRLSSGIYLYRLLVRSMDISPSGPAPGSDPMKGSRTFVQTRKLAIVR